MIEQSKTMTVTILSRGPNHAVVYKPPSVLCHHSRWAGSRKKKLNDGEEPEIPMLQRVRDAIDDIDNQNIVHLQGEEKFGKMKRRVNLVHRLDRGASGALLFAFADEHEDEHEEEIQDNAILQENKGTKEEEEAAASNEKIYKNRVQKGATAALQEQMNRPTSRKTYVALVRGEGILGGEDLKQKGWFEVHRPIKDEKGKLNDATTSFYFVAGQTPNHDNDESIIMQPRISLVLARPQHGRWHQIRRHLNGLSHHILGDRTHGCSKTNKEWKEKRNLPGERVFLHLARLQIPSTKFTPDIDCSCPLPLDMLQMLRLYAPGVLRDARPILEHEGIIINA